MKPQNTPKITKGDMTRRRIMETTARLMFENGPDAVSMREISSRLKITKPVLYYYFKDKDELIKATFEEGAKHFNELLDEINKPGFTLEQKLTSIFSNHLHFMKKHPEIPKCAMKIMASPEGSILNTLAIESKRRNRKALLEMVKGCAEKEGIAHADTELVMHMTSAVIEHFMMEGKEIGADKIPSTLPQRLARLISRGARAARTAAFALALPALLAAGAQAASLDLTLDGAVDTALRNNATVITAEETSRIYKEQVNEYWGTVFPQVSASATYSRYLAKPNKDILGSKPNNLYTGSLDVSQVVWAGGKVSSAIKMAKTYSKASDEQLKTAQNGIAKAVKQTYYAVLLAKEMTGIQKENLDLAKQHLSTIEAQYKQGIASDLAVLRQKVEVSNNEPPLTQAQNLYEEGLIDLKNLLGIDPETEISLSGALDCQIPGGDMSGLYQKALAARPEYRNQKYQLDLYEQNIKIERAGHFPYLSAFASRQYYGGSASGWPVDDDRTWTTVAGLKLSLPLFAGGSVTSRTEQARLQAEIARTNLAELERKIKIQVKKAWLSLGEASERLASQSTAVEQARKALTATEVRFRNGLASQLELNDATLALNKSQTLYTQAQHDTCSAKAELDWTTGN